MCGDRLSAPAPPAPYRGSSPRVRGQGWLNSISAGLTRFIPACAGTGCASARRATTPSVHPRVCGDRDKCLSDGTEIDGSSPRVRGQGQPDAKAAGVRRFIPACAGTGAPWGRPLPPGSVHPRVCGNRGLVAGQRAGLGGSSPRVRGQDARHIGRRDGCRFIPACAGTGGWRPWRRAAAPVHPRVCGDRAARTVEHFARFGSSPRVRGQGLAKLLRAVEHRFIPACAGTGRSSRRFSPTATVHPRVCGDRAAVCCDEAVHVGSSPRVRGQVDLIASNGSTVRFIPACAGTGDHPGLTIAALSVHPRVCGDRFGVSHQTIAHHGSSPRVRGQARCCRCCHWCHRFIPACAGTGQVPAAEVIHFTVHPRVCGDRKRRPTWPTGDPGSSPRVRGQGRRPRDESNRSRFIPACAGTGSTRKRGFLSQPVHPRVCGDRTKKYVKEPGSDAKRTR